MKKLLLIVSVLFGIFSFSFAETQKEEVTQLVNEIIKEANLYGVKINSVQVNTNASKNDGSKIALVYLTWNVSNSASTTRQMLEMYSARIVGKALVKDQSISEAVLFWEVPYHAKGTNVAKFNYFKKNGEFYVGQTWYGPMIR